MCLAIPGQILNLQGDDEITRMARVSFDGIVKEISLAYVPEARTGDYVLVHAGFAIQTIDEAEAERTLKILREMGELDEETGGPGATDA
ncbi:HypC/HybG/HupF family hydrogenase formation chaperone [Paludibaculum fermentans]|uniref:HypC/HybG/HupF family hydrogenase formation chaperone n=1 Tax=Paludibaculum fermentans TaxID=1473598 RepID=A0A7S7SMU2_PALFE|nr:HypC/HybG/HupF family hydrogenase formation chaperone [Paludibaculum fermentans]QOY89841.1 HypC/HybG/HupF family hydrogenase formation chaperone [Paludibaculum fermentans]